MEWEILGQHEGADTPIVTARSLGGLGLSLLSALHALPFTKFFSSALFTLGSWEHPPITSLLELQRQGEHP